MEDKVIEKKEISKEERQKKKGIVKYVIYSVLIVGATTLSYIKVGDKWPQIGEAFKNIYWPWILAAVGIAFFSYVLDALIWNVFMRLYTRKYNIVQGMAVSMVGTFYSSISPGSRGGQTMQAYSLKSQGAEISNAASIIVMNFIIYRIALIGFELVSLIFRSDLINKVGNFQLFNVIDISMLPLIIIGFIVNIFFILLMFLLSYWHGFHNFIMNKGIGLLGKIKIVRNPDKMRERLRIQVENFKIELRRLFLNIPVFILILVLFICILICRYSIPFFIGASMNAFNPASAGINSETFWNICFISSYHQMVTSVIPIPGGAGTSEFFFESLFINYFDQNFIYATQIMWRTLTYYLMIPIAGFVAIFYKGGAKEEALKVDRKTFVNIQLNTYAERKASVDLQTKTIQINRADKYEKLKKGNLKKNQVFKNEQVDLKAGEYNKKDDVKIKGLNKTIFVESEKVDYNEEFFNDLKKIIEAKNKTKLGIKIQQNSNNKDDFWNEITINN